MSQRFLFILVLLIRAIYGFVAVTASLILLSGLLTNGKDWITSEIFQITLLSLILSSAIFMIGQKGKKILNQNTWNVRVLK